MWQLTYPISRLKYAKCISAHSLGFILGFLEYFNMATRLVLPGVAIFKKQVSKRGDKAEQNANNKQTNKIKIKT